MESYIVLPPNCILLCLFNIFKSPRKLISWSQPGTLIRFKSKLLCNYTLFLLNRNSKMFLLPFNTVSKQHFLIRHLVATQNLDSVGRVLLVRKSRMRLITTHFENMVCSEKRKWIVDLELSPQIEIAIKFDIEDKRAFLRQSTNFRAYRTINVYNVSCVKLERNGIL